MVWVLKVCLVVCGLVVCFGDAQVKQGHLVFGLLPVRVVTGEANRVWQIG